MDSHLRRLFQQFDILARTCPPRQPLGDHAQGFGLLIRIIDSAGSVQYLLQQLGILARTPPLRHRLG